METELESLTQLQQLTSQYARYRHSAGGLASVAGGVLCLVSYLSGALLSASTTRQTLLLLVPPAWLFGKQWMASRYYQHFGRVEERPTPETRRIRLFFVSFVALISLIVSAVNLGEREPFGSQAWDLGLLAYQFLVLALPLIAWFCLRNPIDFAVGVFLVCQAALASRGDSYALWSSALIFPAAAMLMIVAGIRDHRQFHLVEMQIRQLMQSRQLGS